MRRLLGLGCALVMGAGCAQGSAPDAAGAEWRERGAAVVLPFRQRLAQELGAALADGGPERAIEVCQLRAPALASDAGSSDVTVGRTSHRLRNAANAPRAWVEPLLAAAVASGPGAQPRAVRLASGGVGYVEPIFVAPPCLACHGDALAPVVEARIRALYPDDRATGFRLGDLRGLFWVEFAAGAKPE